MRVRYQIAKAFISRTISEDNEPDVAAFLRWVKWYDITDRVRKQSNIRFDFSNKYDEFQPSANDLTIEVEDYDNWVENFALPYQRHTRDDIYLDLIYEFGGNAALWAKVANYIVSGDITEYTLLRLTDYDKGGMIYIGFIDYEVSKQISPQRTLRLRAYYFPVKWLQISQVRLPIDEFNPVVRGFAKSWEWENPDESDKRLRKVYAFTYRETENSKVEYIRAHIENAMFYLYGSRPQYILNQQDPIFMWPDRIWLTDETVGRFVRVYEKGELVEFWHGSTIHIPARLLQRHISFWADVWGDYPNPFPDNEGTEYKRQTHYSVDTAGHIHSGTTYLHIENRKFARLLIPPTVYEVLAKIAGVHNRNLIAPSFFYIHTDFVGDDSLLYNRLTTRVFVNWWDATSVYNILSELCKFIDARFVGEFSNIRTWIKVMPYLYFADEYNLSEDIVSKIVDASYQYLQINDIVPNLGVDAGFDETTEKLFREHYQQFSNRYRTIYKLTVPIEIGRQIQIMDKIRLDWLFTSERYFTGSPITADLRVISKEYKLNNSGIYDKITLEVEQI